MVVALLIVGFAIIVAAVALGSAVGDGIVASKAVESIARQPEARGNIFTFFFLGVGILEAFPIIALVLAFYLLWSSRRYRVSSPRSSPRSSEADTNPNPLEAP